jgi:prepilin-type N-terminal cleavage/methylation domain-containing protein/prepilin-type processing-associated H-X9-DG protein
MDRRYPWSRPSGFTLIELLVVISVISLLVAILLPALANARKAAQQVKCQALMRGMGIIALVYDQDHKQLPGAAGTGSAHNQWSPAQQTALRKGYGLTGNYWQCPYADTFQRGITTGGLEMSYDWVAGMGDFDHDGVVGAPIDYGPYNGWRNIAARFPGRASGWFPQLSVLKPDTRSKMPYMMSDYVANYPTPSTNVSVPPKSNHVRAADGKADGTNVLFLDAHVEWHPLIPGVSWRVGGSAYSSHWWTPKSHSPYSGALLWP